MIKAAPPKMDRADFADEARPKLLEDFVDVNQRAPEAIRILVIVRRVRFVFIEANRVWDFNRHRPNLYINPQSFERCHYPLVKIGDRLRAQRQNLDRAITALNHEFVIDKVELDLKNAIPVSHG